MLIANHREAVGAAHITKCLSQAVVRQFFDIFGPKSCLYAVFSIVISHSKNTFTTQCLLSGKLIGHCLRTKGRETKKFVDI